ncbi:5'-nucleotidase [Gemmobacter megaterium]|uniref:5'-nucleotidase n=1 Tax=Gemmobacter megaterium TaxID=1086013 RepID=A0A1N7K619_9RHOB|nr:bifunctional metallophosphatase/5'-nucleotidase [Gemmobacter megaterium]GGE00566.1 multifunctional 2',3'-cyclic-nucleotide 2'-phosphodiesterase/5'-nucleotidase/3'-nucleotidase [Gemmobacter megaterium]SIS57032.1 5'-nucleotidase [Gemmobacter megaterium]
MTARFLISAAALALSAGAASADYTLHVLHINDFHSRIEAINRFDSTCAGKDVEENKCFGGAARLFTKINELRDSLKAAGENVIVVDSGDQYQGSLFYTTYKGDAEIEMMNRIGFDLMAVGNHEFDDGNEGLAKLVNGVKFPVISGNLDLSQSAMLKDKVGRTAVLDVGGQKVGFVSALATDTVDTSSPGPDVIFQDEIESLRAQVAELEGQGVSKIIALTHVGFTRDQEIAASVPGLDAVIGGHSHTFLSASDPKRQGAYPTWVEQGNSSVPVVTAYAYGKYVGHLVLTFGDDGALKFAEGDAILLDASVAPNADIEARVKELAGPIEELKTRIVAEATADIDGGRETCRQQECTMGNLVAEAMLDRVKDQGVTIAIQNGGGLRASIQAGQVSMGSVLAVLPFQNTLATFQAKGSTLIKALENGAGQVEDGAGRFAQVAGMTYTFDPALPAGSRVSDVMVREGDAWVPIDPEATYSVATNDYMRRGGDGYRMFAAEAMNAYDFGPDLADVVAEYMAKTGPYTPALDGRITRK